MWVQEGYDCKDSDDTISNSSLFSRIYQITKPQQTISTIGIPMKSTIDFKSDQKEKEESESPKLKSIVGSISTPISPAQFLHNMSRRNDDTFNISDNDNVSVNLDMALKHIMEPESVESDNGTDINMSEGSIDGELFDLEIVGKKIEIYEQKEINLDEASKETNSDEPSKENMYISKQFDGLDIKRWIEWDDCLDFTKTNNGLLIIELYSKIFGASDVMYPFIDDILHKKQNDKIIFVRLSLNKMNQIDDIKQVIINYREYGPTPIPTYIFIKNCVKMDELKGTKPREFEQLINKYSNNQQIPPQSASKYKSILTQRPKSAYLQSTISVSNKENENEENIRNLINNLDLKYISHS